MSVQTGRMVSADEARKRRDRFASFTQPDHVEQQQLDYAHTIVVQAEQIAAVLALHQPKRLGERWSCSCGPGRVPYPCPTARTLGVSGE